MSDLVKFKPLWDAHPANQGVENPCLNKKGSPAFGNQCAIRMGAALKAVGITVPSAKTTAHCGYSGHVQHVLLAEQLGYWILGQKRRFGTPEKKVGQKWDATNGVTVDHYKGRQGIVFFKDFWARQGENEEKNPTGDHIEVWDGTRQAHGDDNYFRRCKQIWFWELP